MQQRFMQDVQRIYDELQNRKIELNNYYKILTAEHPLGELLVANFLREMGLSGTVEHKEAVLMRIVNLKEDVLLAVMQKAGFSEEKIIEKRALAYLLVKQIHLSRHESFILWIKEEKLLSPFYQKLIEGVHYVGEAMSVWQSAWREKVVDGVNRELLEAYEGDEEAIVAMLKEQNLLDITLDGEVAERCYSVLQKDNNGGYYALSYAEAFPVEVSEVIARIEDLIEELSMVDDEVFEQQSEWVAYFVAIKRALGQTNSRKADAYWMDVDRAWLRITSPLKVAHPLASYEDGFRNAVALEWDLRLDEPLFYYGAELNGFFSAPMVSGDKQFSTNCIAMQNRESKVVIEEVCAS